ncbi:MAG TPA: serine hydrolase [Kofleriaceae bacterium]|nr:serine hydrolase [Kofleriaceae bacterium]
MTVRTASRRALLLLLAAAAPACGGTPAPAPGAPPATEPAAAPAAEAAAAPAAQPAEPGPGPDANESLAWVIATIEGGGAVSPEEIQRRFSPGFLSEVPAEQVAAIFAGLAGELPPVKIVSSEATSPLAVRATLETRAGSMRVHLAMTEREPRQIEGLLFRPGDTGPPPSSFDEVKAAITGAGESIHLLVAELVRGRCKAVHQHQVGRRLAIGSTFKLWVLHALAGKIRGKVTWDTTLPIREELKSLPSGVLQTRPAGTEVTLRELATKMISISDNTATDHLIEFVGREEVERSLRRARHGAPRANTPFLTTREMFALKLAASDAERDAYRKAPVAGKRRMLAEMRARTIELAAAGDWKKPRALDLEWFASARDVCEVYAAIGKAAAWKPDSELLQVLGHNPGVPVDREDWPYVAFKGGSEPGVINLSWMARRADGRWFVVVATVNDDGRALDEAAVVRAAGGALALLGDQR